MMSRNTINFILDVVSFLALLGLTITGFIMKYVLPPGTGGMGNVLHGGTGRNVQVKDLWSMTRHEWGSIHFYLAVVFVILMITHVILHWRWIKFYAKSVASRWAFNHKI